MITVTKVGKHLGAEISGVDLSKPLDDDTFAQIAKAFFDNEVAFFRNQKLTPGAADRFHAALRHSRAARAQGKPPRGHPEILVVSNVLDEKGNAIGAQDAGRFWHSDLSYKKEPSMLSALYAVEVPVKDGRVLGDTSFASTTAAYDALPEEMKQRIQGLKNVHSYRYYRTKNIEAQKEEQARGGRVVQEHVLTEEQLKSVPDVEMPVVRTHPVTGRKGLFINEAHTSHIAGMARRKAMHCSPNSISTSPNPNSFTVTPGSRAIC